MSRYLKMLGLALVAVFAMSAVAASGAMAQQGVLTSDGPFTLTGEDEEGANPGFYFEKGDEAPVTCGEAHYVGETASGGDLSSGATSVTITPTYAKCLFVDTFPTHVSPGCDFDLDIGETIGEDLYDVTAAVGATCVVHIYLSKEATEATPPEPFCTLTITKQGNLSGATVTDETNGHLTLGGEVQGIHIEKSGPCGGGTSTTGSLELEATVEGLDAEGGETHVTITDEQE